MSSVLLVLSNFPDPEAAQEAAHVLVEERLAACINVLPGVTSVYEWDDKVQSESEVTTLIKTTEDRYPQFEKRLAEIHPYDVPEIVAFPVQNGLQSYLHWVNERTKDQH